MWKHDGEQWNYPSAKGCSLGCASEVCWEPLAIVKLHIPVHTMGGPAAK